MVDRDTKMTTPIPESRDVPQFPPCYRHSGVEMAVRCSRCHKPICADCMVSADVGFHCPECAREGARQSPTQRAPWQQSGGVMTRMPVTRGAPLCWDGDDVGDDAEAGFWVMAGFLRKRKRSDCKLVAVPNLD